MGQTIHCTAHRRLYTEGPPFTYREYGEHTPHQNFVYRRKPIAPVHKKVVARFLLTPGKVRKGKFSCARHVRRELQLDHSAFTSTDAKNVKKSVKRRWKTTSNITVSDLRSLVDFFAPAAIITGYHRGLSSPLLGTMGTAVPTSTLPQALPCTPTSTSTYSDHLACGPGSGAGTIHSPTSAVAAQHALASCQLPPATPLVVNSHHNVATLLQQHPHRGVIISTPDDISSTSTLIVMTTPTLAQNLQRSKSTCGVGWLGVDDNDEIFPGGWYAMAAGTHNLDHEGRLIALAFTSDKTEPMHKAFLEHVKNVAQEPGVDVVDITMADQCPAIGNALGSVFPSAKACACWWHIDTKGIRKALKDLVARGFITATQRDDLQRDVWLLHCASSDNLFEAGAGALRTHWQHHFPLDVAGAVVDALAKYLDPPKPWHVASTPVGFQSGNLPLENAFSMLEEALDDAAEELAEQGQEVTFLTMMQWVLQYLLPQWSHERSSWSPQRTHHKVTQKGPDGKKVTIDQSEKCASILQRGFMEGAMRDSHGTCYAHSSQKGKRAPFTSADLTRWKSIDASVTAGRPITANDYRWFVDVKVFHADSCSCRTFQGWHTCAHHLAYRVVHLGDPIPPQYEVVRTAKAIRRLTSQGHHVQVPGKRHRTNSGHGNLYRGIENPDKNLSWAIAAAQLLITCDLVMDEHPPAEVKFEQVDRDVVRNLASALSKLPVHKSLSPSILLKWVEQQWADSEQSMERDAMEALTRMAVASIPPSQHVEVSECHHCRGTMEGDPTPVHIVNVPPLPNMGTDFGRDHILTSMGAETLMDDSYQCEKCGSEGETYTIRNKWIIQGPLLLQLPRFNGDGLVQPTKSKWTWLDWYDHCLGGIIHSNGSCPSSGHYRVVRPRGGCGNHGIHVIDDHKIYGGAVNVPKYPADELYIVAVPPSFFPAAWRTADGSGGTLCVVDRDSDGSPPMPEFGPPSYTDMQEDHEEPPEVTASDDDGNGDEMGATMSADGNATDGDEDANLELLNASQMAPMVPMHVTGTAANRQHQYKGITNPSTTCWMAASMQLLHHNDFVVSIDGDNVERWHDPLSRRLVLHYSAALGTPPARPPVDGDRLLAWAQAKQFDTQVGWDAADALTFFGVVAGGLPTSDEVRVTCCLECQGIVRTSEVKEMHILSVPPFQTDDVHHYDNAHCSQVDRRHVALEVDRKYRVEDNANPFWCPQCEKFSLDAEEYRRVKIHGRTILQLPRFDFNNGHRLPWQWADFGDEVKACLIHVGRYASGGHFRYVHLTRRAPNRGMVPLNDAIVNSERATVCNYVAKETYLLVVEPAFFPSDWVQAEEPPSAEVHPNPSEASEVDDGILVCDPDSSAPVLTQPL